MPPKRFKKVGKCFRKEGWLGLVIIFRIYFLIHVFVRKGSRDENKGR